jgi:hypothetical protein
VEEEYYAPKDITFTKGQIKWIILHLPELKAGHWPDNPRGHAEDPLCRESGKHMANFEICCGIAGDVEKRLNLIGKDGDLIRVRYSELWYEFPAKALAYELNMPVKELAQRIKRGLDYIRGWDFWARGREEYIIS